MFDESFENGLNVLDMFRERIGIDQDIINVYDDPFTEHITEDVIYEGLEDGRTIDQAKGHDPVFIVPSGGGESRLPFITLSDTDEIISTSEIQLGEEVSRTELFEGGRNQR